jgi:hypothetical protein
VTKRAKRRQQDDQTDDTPRSPSTARPAHDELLSRIGHLLRNSRA